MSIPALEYVLEHEASTQGSERVVLLVLAWHHNAKTSLCNPGFQTIAVEAGVSVSSAKRLVKALREAGLIRVEVGGGATITNRYEIVGLEEWRAGKRSQAQDRSPAPSDIHNGPTRETDDGRERSHPARETVSPGARNGPTGETRTSEQAEPSVSGGATRTDSSERPDVSSALAIIRSEAPAALRGDGQDQILPRLRGLSDPVRAARGLTAAQREQPIANPVGHAIKYLASCLSRDDAAAPTTKVTRPGGGHLDLPVRGGGAHAG